MFAQGLDQTAINWINQGKKSVTEVGPSSRTDFEHATVQKSPLHYGNASNYMSPKTLPPLKFHSGFLGKHSLSTLSLCESDESTASNDTDDDCDESVASAPYNLDGYCSENFEQEFSRFPNINNFEPSMLHDSDEEIIGLHASTNVINRPPGLFLNRGSSKINLKVELPETTKKFSHVELDKQRESYVTPDGCSHRLTNLDTPLHHSRYYGADDLGTPSAPTVIADEEINHVIDMDCTMDELTNNGLYMPGNGECGEETKQILSKFKEETSENSDLNKVTHSNNLVVEGMQTPHCVADTLDRLPSYDAGRSSQIALQSLVAYDACTRLCLHAWAKGCPEAPEFLRDECLILRKAFGLNKLVLHPHGIQTEKDGVPQTNEETCYRKPNIVVSKIRVEVKKLRIIPRRKLKSTYSQQGSFYMQVGTEYVRHVSSLVKTGISSLMNSSLSFSCEEPPLSCLFFLKKSIEDAQMDSSSAICLHPGTSLYHDFFPESQGDVLFIEVRDIKQMAQGHALIPISSIAENPNDKFRWWPVYRDEHECIGKIQLSMTCSSVDEEGKHVKTSPVVETHAYDLLLEAAMRAQHFQSRNLYLHGPWKWLLGQFAEYYGVSHSYTNLRYLLCVMKVATPTKDCLELILDLLMPVIKARGENRLSRQEKAFCWIVKHKFRASWQVFLKITNHLMNTAPLVYQSCLLRYLILHHQLWLQQ